MMWNEKYHAFSSKLSRHAYSGKKNQQHSSGRHAQLLTALPVVACITIKEHLFSPQVNALDSERLSLLYWDQLWCHNVWYLQRAECIQPDYPTSDEEHTARVREREKEITGKQTELRRCQTTEAGMQVGCLSWGESCPVRPSFSVSIVSHPLMLYSSAVWCVCLAEFLKKLQIVSFKSRQRMEKMWRLINVHG